MGTILKAIGLQKKYNQLEILKGINLEVQSKEIISIVGASGAGKTTLLQIMGTLSRPDSGDLNYGATNISTLSDKDLSRFRNENIGFIFQFHQLLPEFTALENVCIPAFIDRKQSAERGKYLLELLGLENRMNHKPNELSGGEQQRTAVARALMNNPKVVFADEPSGNLDSANAKQLHELFFKLRDELGQTFVIVTHNEELAQLTDRKLTIQDGIILGQETLSFHN
ncbi:unnamed protein product [Cyprideis torosa]|uniref:Uncharacterized protein n=1 Tax=Cyprideis torosa TaxID=163714 RepID=A0A7R8ZXD2_9CRUS|nr:unnamed protein product [Cyprideis torosa]CAG0906921.1 unnamed protein product [Cyprideis torosa]